ncbi:MAG: hypothetical protein OXG74_21130 [Acidobacteria bacterium]|nr:hypothetical protein [Acidobacteriota bacterium]
MAGSRCFVQLSHPGREHQPDCGLEKTWNTQKHGHARKFMQLHGQWIDENRNRQSGDLYAWGEWEPESELVRALDPPDDDWLHPRWLWRPYYVPKTSYEGLHNTDPFIFGPRFLYSNCFQPSKPGLRQLDEGSVIAFGSSKKVNGWTSCTFLDVTIRPLTGDSPQPKACASARDRLRLYRGATPDDPVGGMFSFFPASPECGDSGFKRPAIDLPVEYINPRAFRAPRGFRRDRTPDELRGVWGLLVEQVHEAGLVLGTFAELPERR